jgi:hypothetical protein
MSFNVALRVDSGILYTLGRRRVDKELVLIDRLTNSVTDTTNRLELDMCLSAKIVYGGDYIPPRVVTPAFRAT